jgi:hypothetical protein
MSATIEIRLTSAQNAAFNPANVVGMPMGPASTARPMYNPFSPGASQGSGTGQQRGSGSSSGKGEGGDDMRRILDQLGRVAHVTGVDTAFKTVREISSATVEALNRLGQKRNEVDGTLLEGEGGQSRVSGKALQDFDLSVQQAAGSVTRLGSASEETAYSLTRLASMFSAMADRADKTPRLGGSSDVVEGKGSNGVTTVTGGDNSRVSGMPVAAVTTVLSRLGPVGIVASVTLGILAESANKAATAIENQRKQLEDFSPALSMASANSEIKTFFAMQRRANRLEPDLVKFRESSDQFNIRMIEIMTEIYKSMTIITTDLIDKTNTTIDEVKKVPVYLEAMQDIGQAWIQWFESGNWNEGFNKAIEKFIAYDKAKEKPEDDVNKLYEEFLRLPGGDVVGVNEDGELVSNIEKIADRMLGI